MSTQSGLIWQYQILNKLQTHMDTIIMYVEELKQILHKVVRIVMKSLITDKKDTIFERLVTLR